MEYLVRNRGRNLKEAGISCSKLKCVPEDTAALQRTEGYHVLKKRRKDKKKLKQDCGEMNDH